MQTAVLAPGPLSRAAGPTAAGSRTRITMVPYEQGQMTVWAVAALAARRCQHCRRQPRPRPLPRPTSRPATAAGPAACPRPAAEAGHCQSPMRHSGGGKGSTKTQRGRGSHQVTGACGAPRRRAGVPATIALLNLPTGPLTPTDLGSKHAHWRGSVLRPLRTSGGPSC